MIFLAAQLSERPSSAKPQSIALYNFETDMNLCLSRVYDARSRARLSCCLVIQEECQDLLAAKRQGALSHRLQACVALAAVVAVHPQGDCVVHLASQTPIQPEAKAEGGSNESEAKD